MEKIKVRFDPTNNVLIVWFEPGSLAVELETAALLVDRAGSR
jgi:hypothetical protein